MNGKIRSVLGVACVLALFACKRDNVDRDHDRTATTDRPNMGGTTYDKSGSPVTVDHDRDTKTGDTTITGATYGTVSNEAAINRIIAARCAREASCNNVGSDKHFTSADVCSRELRTNMKDDLNAKECPKGISAKELDECMESIRKESCNNPIDTISRLAACRTSDLCLSADEKNR